MCIFSSILTFDFPLFSGLMEGLQKAQSQKLAVEELADTAAWSSFTSQPESGVVGSAVGGWLQLHTED